MNLTWRSTRILSSAAQVQPFSWPRPPPRAFYKYDFSSEHSECAFLFEFVFFDIFLCQISIKSIGNVGYKIFAQDIWFRHYNLNKFKKEFHKFVLVFSSISADEKERKAEDSRQRYAMMRNIAYTDALLRRWQEIIQLADARLFGQ